MAFIPSPGVGRVTIDASVGDTSFVNVFHVKQPAGATVFDMAALALAAWDAWEAFVLPWLPNNYVLNQVLAADQTSDTAPVGQYTEATKPTGATIQDMVALGTSCVVTLRTAARGRSARGRLYIGPIGEGYLEDGSLSATAAAGIQGAIEDVRAALATAGWNLGVLSLYGDGAPRAEGLFRPVTAVVVRSTAPGYQKRRTGRR